MATLICSLEGFPDSSIPVTVTVVGGTIPTSIVTQTYFDGTMGKPVSVPRPVLLPEGTDLDPDLFDFGLWGNFSQQKGDSQSGYQVTFDKPGYYSATVYMGYSNIGFNQEVLFAIADMTGTVPGTPISLSESKLEKTFYLKGPDEFDTNLLGYVWLSGQTGLGNPKWTITDIKGTAVKNLRIDWSTWYGCSIRFDSMAAVGNVTAKLTCTVGRFKVQIPLLIHVAGGTVPTSMDTPASYSALVGAAIDILRPVLSPAGTSLHSDAFTFELDGPFSSRTGTSVAGYQVTFDKSGYYWGSVWMSCGNINFYQRVLFAIDDGTGTIPGNPIQFDRSEIANTLYLHSSDLENVYIGDLYLENDISSLGTPEWTLTDIQGSSVDGLRIGYEYQGGCAILCGAILSAGDTAATLTCSAGGFSNSIPVKITVSEVSVPTSMETQTSFSGQVGQAIIVPRPALLPAGTGLGEEEFFFSLYGSNDMFWNHVSIQGNQAVEYKVTFDAPGFYGVYIYMECNNVWFQRYGVIAVADKNGNLPIFAPAIERIYALGSTSLRVIWEEAAGAEGYELWHATSKTGIYTRVYSGSGTAFTNTGRTAGTVYYYKVRGYRTVRGVKKYSPYGAPVAGIPLAAPTVSQASAAGPASIKIAWGAVTAATGYELLGYDQNDDDFTRLYTGTSSTYTHTGIKAGTPYYYVVRAYKTVGTVKYNGPYSGLKGGVTLDAPGVLWSETQGGSSIRLNWGTAEYASGYELRRATSLTGTYTRVYVGPDSTYTDTGRIAGTVYYYKVRAYLEDGESKLYGLDGAAIIGISLSAPVITRASAASLTGIKVTWVSAASATGYELWGSETTDGDYTRLYTGTSLTYTHTGRTTGTPHHYKARAYKLIGTTTYFSPLGEAKAGVTLAGPALLKAEALSGSSIQVTWGEVGFAMGYELRRATSSTGSYALVYSGIDMTYTDTGRKVGTVYYYKVRAWLDDGTTKLCGLYGTAKAVIALAPPASLTAGVLSGSSVKLTWGGVSSATGYELQRSASENGAYTRVYLGTLKTYTNTGRIPGTVYYYRVHAYKTIGTTNYYGPLSPVKAIAALAGPVGLRADVSVPGSVTLSWTGVTGAQGYELWRVASAAGTYAFVKSGTDTRLTDDTPTAGVMYYYKVKAFVLIQGTPSYGPNSAYISAKPL